MSIRPVAKSPIVSLLLGMIVASVGPGQVPDNVKLSTLASQPYPWPAPVDSQRHSAAGPSAADPSGFSMPSGQWQQQQLAAYEAARSASRSSSRANGGPGHATSGSSPTSKWHLPWPSSLSPSWLAKLKADQSPTDPFLRQTQHSAAASESQPMAGTTTEPPGQAAYQGRATAVPAVPTTPTAEAAQAAYQGRVPAVATAQATYPPAGRRDRARGPAQPPYRGGYQPPSSSRYEPPRQPPYEPVSRPRYESPPPVPPRREPLSPPPAVPPGETSGNEFEPARIVAMVGDQPILAGDMLGQINEILKGYLDRLPEEQRRQLPEKELQLQRMRLMQQLLPQMVDLQLQYLDFVRKLPKDRMEEIQQKVNERFTEDQLPQLVKRAKVSSAKELDAKLRLLGSSVDQQRRLFAVQVLAAQARHQGLGVDELVTPDEMLAYYYQHIQEYEYPAKVRWERLTVRFDKFPSKQEAWQAIAEMGNQVVHGAPLASVARRRSQGPNAEEGGYHDWTTRGSLVSEPIDRALFELEVNVLSKIIEDQRGFHIVRVIERRDAGRVSFEEAQVEIKEKILQQRREAKQKEYLRRLRQQTRVWTIFDDSKSSPLPDANPRARF